MTTQKTIQTCPTSQSLNDWLFYLESQHPAEIELGLQRVKTVAEQGQLTSFGKSKIVLVAGTNGKGTTIRFMEQYLLSKGFSVGVYSSPHMHVYPERVRINDSLLNDEQHVAAFQYIDKIRGTTPLTYFEYGTLAAFSIFKQAELDYVLVEVGLGGRLDATNILPHELSVVTSLGLDHTDWLGDTIELIGFEKAGIFRSGKPALVGMIDPPSTVFEQAENLNVSELNVAGRDYQVNYSDDKTYWQLSSDTFKFEQLPRPLIPVQNVATAIVGLNLLGVDLDINTLRSLCSTISLYGRMQLVSTTNPLLGVAEPDRSKEDAIKSLNQVSAGMAMVDVGHNSHALGYLIETINTHPVFSQIKNIDVVIAMMADKDIDASLKCLAPHVRKWHLGSLIGNKRAAPKEVIQQELNKLGETNIVLHEDVKSAWKTASLKIDADTLLLGVGSFYTVAEILSCIDGKG